MQTSPTTAEYLESLGKASVDLARTKGIGLTEAITSLLSQENLSIEQVRRVVEFANIDAFNRRFAETSGDYRMVSVEGGPADPAQVLQNLHSEAREKTVMHQTSDYDYAPSVTDIQPPEDSEAVEPSDAKVAALAAVLPGAHRELVDGLNSEQVQAGLAFHELADHVKRACLQGASLSQLHAQWAQVDADVAKEAALALMPLEDELPLSREKIAGEINPKHPVCTLFTKFASHIRRAQVYAGAIAETEAAAEKLASARAGAAVGKLLTGGKNVVTKVVGSGGDFGKGLAPALGMSEAAGSLLGKGAVIGTGVLGAKRLHDEFRAWKYRHGFA